MRRHAQVLSEVLGDGHNNGVSTDTSFIEARAAGSGYSPEGFVVDSASGELTLVELKARAGRRPVPLTAVEVDAEHVLQCMAVMAHSGATSAVLSYWQGRSYTERECPRRLTLWRVQWDSELWAGVMRHVEAVLAVRRLCPAEVVTRGGEAVCEWLERDLPAAPMMAATPRVRRVGQWWWQ